jgi:hypothetical protein
VRRARFSAAERRRRAAHDGLFEVDVGVLKLDYQVEGFFVRTGTMHKSVVSGGPDALADHKGKLPSSIARLVHRPMTLVGPADVAIKGH